MRLIDADALPLEPYGEDVISWYATGWNDAINAINRAPTVDAYPVRHGEWIDSTVCVGFYECSQCRTKKRGNQPFFVEVWNYCPNCGAKMGGKQDAE